MVVFFLYRRVLWPSYLTNDFFFSAGMLVDMDRKIVAVSKYLSFSIGRINV